MRDVARDHPVGLLANPGDRVILDEIQYQPQLLHYIKDDIDAHRQPGRWLLTGSQNFVLMRAVSHRLPGRIAVIHLDPLAVSEVTGSPDATSLSHRLNRLCADLRSRRPRRRPRRLAPSRRLARAATRPEVDRGRSLGRPIRAVPWHLCLQPT